MIPVRLLWILPGLTVHVVGQQQDGDCPPPVGKFLSLNGWRYENNREIKFHILIFDVSYFDVIVEVREQPGDPCEGAEEGWRPGGKAQSGGQPVLQNTKYTIQNMHTQI